MEEKKVILYVRGEQYFEDVDPEATELISEGVMTISDGGVITLVYDETELTGLEGTTTTFVIDGGMVTLTRSGELNSQMIFQMGKRHTSLYETPWGTLTVDVTTTGLSCRMGALHRRGPPGDGGEPVQGTGAGGGEIETDWKGVFYGKHRYNRPHGCGPSSYPDPFPERAGEYPCEERTGHTRRVQAGDHLHCSLCRDLLLR